MTEACDLDAVEARRLIGCKRLSAAELVESCIARTTSVDPAVNALVARDFDRARDAAAACDAATMRGDALGPLHGLPLGVKDLEDVAGLRTTYGSTLFRDHVPTRDELIVQASRRAGAIVLGKTNTPERGIRRDGQSVRPEALCGRIVRRVGRGACDRHGPARHRV